MKDFLKHAVISFIGVFLLIGFPFLMTSYCRDLIKEGHVDIVASASIILDQPSGDYVVLINSRLHPNKNRLKFWMDFFSGHEVTFTFEDISCSVARGDAGALEMAQSFRSRLPENQMVVMPEDSTLLLSRADNGKFDIIIMSAEFIEKRKARTSYGDGIIVINLIGGSSTGRRMTDWQERQTCQFCQACQECQKRKESKESKEGQESRERGKADA